MPGVPYIFATATTSIPLSELDANFNTPVTIGSTTVGLGNTVSTLTNVTLSNATITSVSTPITVSQGGTGLTSLTAGYIPYGNGTSAFSSSSSLYFDGTNLGVGTSSPGAKLDVQGNINMGGDLVTGAGISTGDCAIELGSNRTGNGNSYIDWHAQTSVDADFRIIRFAGANGPASIMNAGTGALTFNMNGSSGNASGATEVMRIDSSGNLLVGATSQSSGYTGQLIIPAVYNRTSAVAANAGIDSTYAFFRSTSALKYKQDVRDLESIDISKFRAVRYKSKCEGDDQTKDHFGFIADEVLTAGYPELVTFGENNEVEGFQYERMTAVLLKTVQEQQAIITDMAAKLKTAGIAGF